MRLISATNSINSLEMQGSTIRSDAVMEEIIGSLGKDCIPSGREKISGVGISTMRNEVILNKCNKDDGENKEALWDEARDRNLIEGGEKFEGFSKRSGKPTWTDFKRRIFLFEIDEWNKANDGTPVFRLGNQSNCVLVDTSLSRGLNIINNSLL